MSEWNDIKPRFRNALIDEFEFDSDGLADLLKRYFDERNVSLLGKLPHKSEETINGINVDTVITYAERTGSLENLAEGALDEKEDDTDLSDAVQNIRAGVAEKGKAYYQYAREWKELKRSFRHALINGLSPNRLATVLEYHSEYSLDHITSKSEGLERNVDDVIKHAARNGWLEDLARGALVENSTHTGLKATVPYILAGVADEGKVFYQPPPPPPPPPPDDREFIAAVLSVAGGLLLAIVVMAIATLVVVAYAIDPDRVLGIFVAVAAAISLAVVAIAFRWSSRFLVIGALAFLVGLTVSHLAIDWFTPWCSDAPIQLETGGDRQVVQNNEILVDPGTKVSFFAVPDGENINESRFVCDWEYEGDGEAKKDGCQVLITTGENHEADSITALVRQTGCPYFARESAFIMPAVGGGG